MIKPINLEFTATECIRPEIVARSLKSFRRNLHNVDFAKSTLWINIDPTPRTGNWKDVYSIVKRHFKTVNYNVPDKPNFCKAIKWCWSQPQSPIFFHLELDWVLNEAIDIKQMQLFFRKKNIAAVNLRAYIAKQHAICLSPCLLRTKAARSIAERMNPKYNPERQLRPKGPKEPNGRDLQGDWKSVHYPKYKVIRDIGRKWMAKNKVSKATNKKTKRAKHNFNRWY